MLVAPSVFIVLSLFVLLFLLFNHLPDLRSFLLASSSTLLLALPHPSLILGPSFGSQCGLKVNLPETFRAFSTSLGMTAAFSREKKIMPSEVPAWLLPGFCLEDLAGGSTI